MQYCKTTGTLHEPHRLTLNVTGVVSGHGVSWDRGHELLLLCLAPNE